MWVEQLPGLESEHIVRLRAAGVRSCRQLLHASRQQETFLRLAESTGLPLETLQTLVHQAELSQIRGIGPTNLSHLQKAGVDSLRLLADQEPEPLRSRLQQVLARPPNLAVIEDWILQARRRQGRRTKDRYPPYPRP